MNCLLEIAFPNIDPVIFPLFGGFALRWYGLAYLVAFITGYMMLRYLQKRGYFRFGPGDCSSYIVYAVVGTMAGGRLGYLLFYSDYFWTGEFFKNPLYILGFHDGHMSGLSGLSFHGGLLGTIIACSIFLYIRTRRQFNQLPQPVRDAEDPQKIGASLKGVFKGSFGQRMRAGWCDCFDTSVLGLAFAIFIIRIFGNFINGELYGKVVTGADGKPVLDAAQAPAWAMRFPTSPEGQDALVSYYRTFVHSDEGRAQVEQLVKKYIEANGGQPPAGVSHTELFGRAQAEIFNDGVSLPVDPKVWHDISQTVALRHPSQIYEAVLEGLIVLILLLIVRPKLPKRGMVAGVFLMGYGSLRYIAEFWRQPDKQFEAGQELSKWGDTLAAMHMSQGQFLCVIMAALGLIMFGITARSRNPFMVRSPEELALKRPAMTWQEAGEPMPPEEKKRLDEEKKKAEEAAKAVTMAAPAVAVQPVPTADAENSKPPEPPGPAA